MHENKLPLVSVVIACYNHQSFVQESIQSVIDQTYQNIELIIIDDGSQDGSVEKIQEMIPACKERFFRFEFRYRPNKGLSATLNEALEWCCGEFYSPFSSDDIMKKYKISSQVNYILKRPNCAGVFGGVELIDKSSLQRRVKKSKSYSFLDILMHDSELPSPTQLLRINIVREVGGYLNNLIVEDWYMWLKITQEGFTLDYIGTIYAKYRYHDNNTSKKYDLILEERLKIIDIFADEKNLSYAKGYAYLVAANDWVSVNKTKSLYFYKKYLFCNERKNILELFFKIKSFKYLFKFLVV